MGTVCKKYPHYCTVVGDEGELSIRRHHLEAAISLLRKALTTADSKKLVINI